MDEMESFERDDFRVAATGSQQRRPQLFHAGILLTLYNANSHLLSPNGPYEIVAFQLT